LNDAPSGAPALPHLGPDDHQAIHTFKTTAPGLCQRRWGFTPFVPVAKVKEMNKTKDCSRGWRIRLCIRRVQLTFLATRIA
jgi:hypothetical protein